MSRHYRSLQIVLFVLLLLVCLVIIMASFLHFSICSYPYILSAFSAVTSSQSIVVGFSRMKQEREQQRQVVWHKQPSLLVGIALLLGAIMIVLQLGLAIQLSSQIQLVLLIVTWVVFGIPIMFFLFRWIFYGVKKRLKALSNDEL